jgi:hypothetical protein
MSGAESIKSILFLQESPGHAQFGVEKGVSESEIFKHFHFGLVLESAIFACPNAITLAVMLLCESVISALAIERTHLLVAFVGTDSVIIQSNGLFL